MQGMSSWKKGCFMENNTRERGGKALARAVKELYSLGQTDYSLEPIVLANKNGNPVGRISDGDTVIFCCRRGEREIELTEAFTQQDFQYFPRPDLSHLEFIILTLYHEKFKDLPVAFAPKSTPHTLGEVVSNAGLRQLRVSESEKFAHVTFFFNGSNNLPFPGEDDVRVPTLKGVPFEKVPGLSLQQVADRVLDGIKKGYDLIVTNFANGDVIGHTANNQAKIKCAEIVDANLGRVLDAAVKNDYVVLITADHGNLEEMINLDGTMNVSHTANPVQLIVIDPRSSNKLPVENGILADVAPTILSALGVNQPGEMSGKNLLPGRSWKTDRKVLLIILDGWGIGKQDETNPIYLAYTPFWDDLIKYYPHSQLGASGEAVGLVAGKAGNSEAGHMNLGAGRIVLQDDVRLDNAMKDGTFYKNEIFLHAIERVKENKADLHLIALLTKKSSHGTIDYPLAILKMAKTAGLDRVYLHLIFDGRSTQPGSAPGMLEDLDAQISDLGLGQVVSGVGRGIALDRDGNYDKIRRAFDAFVSGIGKTVSTV
jgi:2,3-bisphosphoglycerate-independent phosphoglycerate mutase